MKYRQANFYVEQDRLPDILRAVLDELIPSYRDLPHFMGVTLIKADHGERAEVIATSFWDDGLEGSDEAPNRFVDAVDRITGSNPSRRRFDTLYVGFRAGDGTFIQA